MFAKNKPNATIILDKRRPKKTGLYPTRLRITNMRELRHYPTGIDLTEADFTMVFNPQFVGKDILPAQKKKLQEYRFKLDGIRVHANQILMQQNFFSFEKFEELMFSKNLKIENVYNFYDRVINAMAEKGHHGTAGNYTSSMKSLQRFRPKLEFKDVTPKFLNDFETWFIGKGRSISTVGIYMRPLRAILNIAIEEKYMNKDDYPFGKRRYQIPASKNVKKALSLEEIRKIYFYEPLPNTWWQRAQDMWLFSYFANGINMKDIALLKKENIEGDYLRLVRAKTQHTNRAASKQISIYLTDDLKRIIKRYESPDCDYLFRVLDKNTDSIKQHKLIKQFVKMVNDYIGRIAKEVGIDKHITTYHARHSFATVLKRSGASTEMISESLGHSSMSTTASYLDSFEDETKRDMMKALKNF
ncbi:MAG: site-specific integrase [Bacteroidetes bacterium]|nr:site-specific integrase [Bacteroidota bacterium]